MLVNKWSILNCRTVCHINLRMNLWAFGVLASCLKFTLANKCLYDGMECTENEQCCSDVCDRIKGKGKCIPGLTTDSIFFCILFAKKNIDLPVGQINVPLSGKHYSLAFILCRVSDPWRAFWATMHPSRMTIDLPCVMLPELQRHKDTLLSGVPRCERMSQDTVKNGWRGPGLHIFLTRIRDCE